jgi:hypothetical protein
MMILPRQARDKHRENSQTERFVAGYIGIGAKTPSFAVCHFVPAKNDHFTKTGLRQPQGNHSKSK